MIKLVENPQLNQIQNLQLLAKLGDCIANTILYSEDAENFKYILSSV